MKPVGGVETGYKTGYELGVSVDMTSLCKASDKHFLFNV
jgi:hypothetical protein